MQSFVQGEIEAGEKMRAFVFPGQGGGVSEPAAELLPRIRRVVGERVPDQVKLFARAAQDADESRELQVRPDVVAGHSLGESEGSVVANYNSPRQTVVSGLRGALGDAVSKVRGRKIPLNVSFAAHSPYVAAAGEKMREVLDTVEFRVPEVPIVSAVDGTVLTNAEAVREALKQQMVVPVRWVKVVETLARMRVEEWIELGGSNVLTRMLRDFELPSLRGMTFEDLRARLSEQAQSLLPRQD